MLDVVRKRMLCGALPGMAGQPPGEVPGESGYTSTNRPRRIPLPAA